ncbi:MAG: metal-dependent hydrolase [Nanopusillaceae archaeon]
MIARLHQTLSLLLSYLLFYYIFSFDKISSIIIAIFVGIISTIPDFDYKIFKWSNKQYLFLNKTKLKYPLFPYYLFILFLIKIFKHRGITHSIFPIILFFLLGFFTIRLFYLFSLAFLLHIIEDSLTVSGIQPFYPLLNFKFVIPILNNKKHRKLQIFLSYLTIFIFLYFIIFL